MILSLTSLLNWVRVLAIFLEVDSGEVSVPFFFIGKLTLTYRACLGAFFFLFLFLKQKISLKVIKECKKRKKERDIGTTNPRFKRHIAVAPGCSEM